ncbi:tripartite tricarboxylate transporter TctB family protein [Bradyrhizobium valentinum]|uniref:Tripartite tricarboxylate transporter TctB n=1 Tax=Bradyrhizobium valentinum TaxID=1518501 RepID=A0A0R3L759_9BRAD|nr:tripartite tricarboxylate transporter TctB family protein [Bradyrhizobium valentinum]KRR03022.1 tripartite tricarboxylate transporter TctB [Bradyrhizobium valentinum]KRR07822.1 tripartite tricarboxylate transporter TctB [Bradyrhizobium valentinum]
MISRRALEIATAALTGIFGVVVVVSSIDNGIGWSSAGVDAGTFPFLTGIIIVLGSLYNMGQGALGRGTLAMVRVAVTPSELRRLAGLFVPAAIFVAVIPIVGMYLASAGYVFAVLALPKQQSVFRAIAIAVATPLALYVVFERMFQVSLPRGALAAAFGF